MVPQESRRTFNEVPSDPLRVTIPRDQSMEVTVCTGSRLENTSGFVWMITGQIVRSTRTGKSSASSRYSGRFFLEALFLDVFFAAFFCAFFSVARFFGMTFSASANGPQGPP
jgi:hypothetical protein